MPAITTFLAPIIDTLILLIGFIHALLRPIGEWFNVSVLGAWEESIKSLVREWFSAGFRLANTTAAVFASLFTGRSYRRARREAKQGRSAVWSSWWHNRERSTFNALLEREGIVTQQQPQNGNTASTSILDAFLPESPSSSTPTSPLHRQKKKWWRAWRVSGPKSSSFSSGTGLFVAPPSGYAAAEAVSRRGLLEDAQTGVELVISWIFNGLRSLMRLIFFLDQDNNTPRPSFKAAFAQSDSFKAVFRGKHSSGWEDLHVHTASDAILRAGYPLEEHTVTTEDGYMLQLHRIPRNGCKDVALFQHGVLDTSLGWVSNGAAGSAAFAAYDSGFDVWLSNSRSNPPRHHEDIKVRRSARYWKYTANELAMKDIAAVIEYIHFIKMSELKSTGGSRRAAAMKVQKADSSAMHRSATESALAINEWVEDQMEHKENGGAAAAGDVFDGSVPMRRVRSASCDPIVEESEEEEGVGEIKEPKITRVRGRTSSSLRRRMVDSGSDVLPYCLQAVGHSLGAGCLLMYATWCKMEGKPHRLTRLILMSPAGFHPHVPFFIRPCIWAMPIFVKAMDMVMPGKGIGLRLPTPFLRYVTFKLLVDLQKVPALEHLVRSALRVATGGDVSQWDRAMQMPHYSTASMPAVSLHTAAHFAQWARDPHFRAYDYGSSRENQKVYGSKKPPSMAENYRLLDIPVDLASGKGDGLIPRVNVEQHKKWLVAGGVKVTLREYDYGHLDFTFAVKDDIRTFVLSRLKQ